MNIQVRIDDRQIREVLSRLQDANWNGIRAKQAVDIYNRSKAPGGTPVDTGELRLSGQVDTYAMTFGYTKEYAPDVEFGTQHQRGQHYLQRNCETQKPIYLEDVKREIKRCIGK